MRLKNIWLKIIAVGVLAVGFVLGGGSEWNGLVVTVEAVAPLTETADESVIPAAYCMKDEYVIFVQNQDAHGYCWNFASSMAASTTLMKATNEYYELSELWFGVAGVVEDGHDKIGAGGWFETQRDIMKSAGVMLEVDLPYQTSYLVSNENAADYYNFYRRYANDDVSDCLVSVDYSIRKQGSVDAMKEHIYNYGSLYIDFDFKTGFVEDGAAYYLPPDQKNTNSCHAISVIGWDDNYTKTLTVDGKTKEYTGAWIVMNSYTETNSNESLAFIFYEDTNLGWTANGYKYVADTEKDFYFYDRIESGYAYPIDIKGKYHSQFVAESALTKQKNIFYDDVALEYSFVASEGVYIESLDIYLGDQNVTENFSVTVDAAAQTFSICAEDAPFGQYKVLVTYTNGEKTDAYLNNFFVTYGLIGEGVEFDTANNDLGFATVRDLEFYAFTAPNKNYVIYTNQLGGTVTFVPLNQSVYSEVNMSVPTLSYEIIDGDGCAVTHTVTSNSGYELSYTFNFEYYEDLTLQNVFVYYDLDGGVNHPSNYGIELANATTDLVLYAPTREGYTFEGWYLDYGNGSVPLEKDGDTYRISWDDIHHMGEAPTVYAKSHYKKYYLNSNTVFVYARWEEVTYYDVELTITGNGTAQIGDRITVSKGESLNYLFDLITGHCLSGLAINGAPVECRELIDIAQNGLLLENIDRDMTIDVTVSAGTYLRVDVGENIKSVYVKRREDGLTVTYQNGDILPYMAGYVQYELVVELRDDEGEYTYIFNEADAYTPLEKGRFSKKQSRNSKNGTLLFTVGSATPTPKQAATVSYRVGGYVVSHYVSSDINATEGDAEQTYTVGDVVYLFVQLPADTEEFDYWISGKFTYVGDGWYRRAVYLTSDTVDLGLIEADRDIMEYTVLWLNWDGTPIYSTDYRYGEIPCFYDTATRESDQAGYRYELVGWDAPLLPVTCDVTYTAVFELVPIHFTVDMIASEGGSILHDDGEEITCEETKTYRFVADEGYQVADVLVNGVSVGAVEAYTLAETLEDISIEVIFERISYTVTWRDWDGTVIQTETYYHGDTVVAIASPERKSDDTYRYTFAGWDKEISVCLGDIIYTATYTAEEIETPDPSETETETETQPDIDAETEPETDTETEPETDTETEPETDTETEPETDTETEPETDTETEPETETQPVTEPEMKPETEPESETGSEVETEIETESETETVIETKPTPAPETLPQTETETEEQSEQSGCRGSLSLSIATVAVLLLAGFVSVKKREE